jgi:hypothetical protein
LRQQLAQGDAFNCSGASPEYIFTDFGGLRWAKGVEKKSRFLIDKSSIFPDNNYSKCSDCECNADLQSLNSSVGFKSDLHGAFLIF